LKNKTIAELIEEATSGLNSSIYPSAEYRRLLIENSGLLGVSNYHLLEQRRLSELMEIYDPLKDLRSLISSNSLGSVVDEMRRQMEYGSLGSAIDEARRQMEVGSLGSVVDEILKRNREMLEYQNLSQSILGYSATEQLRRELDSIAGTSAIDILNTMRDRALYLGEYEFEPEVENESEEPLESKPDSQSTIILPEDADFQLKRVDYFPISIIQKVISDPELMRKIPPRDFELFVGELIDKLGFSDVSVTPRSNDQGRDIIASKSINGVPVLFAFECKQYSPNRKIQIDTMRSLLGTISHGPTKANIGVLVTTSTFTKGAKNFYLSEALLDGKDFNDLVNWLKQVKSKIH
tara:strand:+ start:104 stop:1153 length:1050 start_codon:yes stop_codon:yes gene_type:complete